MSLSDISGRLATHAGLRHLLFLGAALLSMLLIGYQFGTFDQVVHIPFMKAAANPSLYPGDEFVALRNPPTSFFWVLFIPFYRWGILEVSLFVFHCLATYLTFWAVWSLSISLFKDTLAGVLAVLAFIFPHFGFLGFPVIEFSLLNRTFVLPFLLFAINLYLNKRHKWAFLLLGLAANFHALSAGMVFMMLLFASLVEVKRVGLTTLFQAVLLCILGAAPLVLLMAGSGRVLDWSLRPEWLSVVARGILYQVFFPFSTIPYILLLTLGGCSAVGLILVSQPPHQPDDPGRATWLMLSAASVIFAVGILTALLLPVTVLIELQLNRASLFILIFAYLYFAGYLAQKYRAGQMEKTHFGLLAGSFIVSTSPIMPLVFWGIIRWLKPRKLRWSIVTTCVAGSLAVFLAVALALGVWSPGIYVFPRQTSWLDVQQWAQENTPIDAVFITPPEKGDIYEPDWRVFSERSSVISVIELLEVALAPEYLATWQERFTALAPGALEQFNGIYFESDRAARRAFYNLTDQALLDAATRYHAAYLVVEKPNLRDFPIVYENQDYVIHSIR